MQKILEIATAPWRVVLIDDNDIDRSEVRRLLLRGSERRYTFVEAETGTAGMALVLEGSALPDCVLLDYNLPDMDALDVLEGLAGPDGLPVCPVVVLTGGAGLEARRTVLRAGAQDYIGKDWLTPPGLTWVVENAIERLAMARQLLLRDEALRRNEKVLAEADRRKDEFIAMLAHELRNPLAPIRTGSQLLRVSEDAHVKRSTLDIIDRQLGQMTRLIDDLLDVSRITNSKILLCIEHISVISVIEMTVEAARPAVDAGRHQLLLKLSAEDLWLNADSRRLVQVIGNLLNNSAKYSGDGGLITLSTRRERDDVVIEVSDSGVGLSADKLEEVFEMFSQVNHTLARSQGGLGIGLALVKRLVEMHDGSVTAESAGLGMGSVFTIRLPCESPPEMSALIPAMPDEPTAISSKRILVVDDNVDAATTLSMLLDFSGHDLRTAFSGAEALEVVKAFQPQLVFLDIGMPGMNGYEVARRLRADPRHQDVVLVALTGWGSESDRINSKNAGFDAHLTKPVDPAAVEEILTSIHSFTVCLG